MQLCSARSSFKATPYLGVVRELERVQQAQPPGHGVVAGRELRAAQPEVAGVPEEPAQQRIKV